MPASVYFLTLICVAGIAAGQILFKLTANAMNAAQTVFAMKPLIYFSGTIFLYGITSIGWVLILRSADLGKIYPFMALAFVLVPLASHYIFDEKFSQGFFIGSALLISGLIVIFASGK